MNVTTFERGQLAAFCYKRARHTGSLNCMKAIAYIMRNRVRAGWGSGWLDVIAGQFLVEGNDGEIPQTGFNSQDRLLQLFLREIDDIYVGSAHDPTRDLVGEGLYFHFIDQPPTKWFVDNIIKNPADHPRFGAVGPILIFG